MKYQVIITRHPFADQPACAETSIRNTIQSVAHLCVLNEAEVKRLRRAIKAGKAFFVDRHAVSFRIISIES